jgi:tetratricopeptide (TPR) repeat protein
LKPGDLPALMIRAEIRIGDGNILGARADLDEVDRTAAKQSDVRFHLAQIYAYADLLDAAIGQYDLWIPYHGEDAKIVTALNARCWERALLGKDLAEALKDCNAAIKMSTKDESEGSILDSRGLVYLRLGNYDKAIADYDAALKLKPKAAWSWYGRGIAKLRKSKPAEGQADMAEAQKIAPKIAEQYARRGITP